MYLRLGRTECVPAVKVLEAQRRTTAHTCGQVRRSFHLKINLWTVGENQISWRKPKHAQNKQAHSAQKGWNRDSNPESRCQVTALITALGCTE